MRSSFITGLVVGFMVLGGADGAKAAADRASSIVNQLYTYNHPLALQLPGEVETKMKKMEMSPFFFYRGTAHIFYQDMVTHPTAYTNTPTSRVWIAGDMHLDNLNARRDNNGNDVFDISDFDEGYFGSFVWELRRLSASIAIVAQQQGFGTTDTSALINQFLDSYLDQIAAYKGNDTELQARITAGNASGVVKDLIQKEAADTRGSFLDKYTIATNGPRRFVTSSTLVPVSASVADAITKALPAYVGTIAQGKQFPASYYTVKDIRQKLGSGTGSLGRYRYWVLIEGPSGSDKDDVILELKQEATSAVAFAAPGRFPASAYGNHEGERVALSFKAGLNNADLLIGWATINGHPYFVHEKSPYQEDFDETTLTSVGKFMNAVTYAGQTIATTHALADKDYDSGLVPYSMDKEITDLVGTNRTAFKTEIVTFALDYQKQVMLDWQDFLTARKNGVPLY